LKPLYTVYFACFGEEGGVARALLFDDGTLNVREFVPLPSPLYLALSETELHVLLNAPFGTGESGYTVLPLSESGALGAVADIRPTGGGEACHLSLFEGACYVANYQTGSVARLPEKGERLLRVHEGGDNPARQGAPHPHFIAPSPDGTCLLCTDLGTDSILVYDRYLNPQYTAKLPTGSGPRHLAYAADGKTVYCVNEMGNSVTVFAYENGHLTSLNTVSTLPTAKGESYAAAIRVWDDLVVVSNRGNDSLTVFRAEGERLTVQEAVSTGGKWPRDFHVFGDFLLCANERSDTVTVFRKKSGHLERCSALSLPRPLCVVGRPTAEEKNKEKKESDDGI